MFIQNFFNWLMPISAMVLIIVCGLVSIKRIPVAALAYMAIFFGLWGVKNHLTGTHPDLSWLTMGLLAIGILTKTKWLALLGCILVIMSFAFASYMFIDDSPEQLATKSKKPLLWAQIAKPYMMVQTCLFIWAFVLIATGPGT
jgi:hypothetical protein